MTDHTSSPPSNVATVLQTALAGRNGPWLAKNAVDPLTGEHPTTRSAVDQIMTKQRKSWLKAGTIRGFSALLDLHHSDLYIPNAIDLHLDPPPAADQVSQFARTLPAWVDQLPIGDQMVIRDLVLRLGEARGVSA